MNPAPLDKVPGDPVASRIAGLINEHHGGSIRATADAAKVPYNTLWRLVRGYRMKRQAVNLPLLTKLAKHFGTTTDWIITGKDGAHGD